MLKLEIYSPERAPEYESQAKLGPAFVLLDEAGDLVATGGVMIPWEGLGTCWFFLNRVYRVREMFAITLQQLAGIIRTYGLKRVDAHVDAEYAAGIRFARHLGFEPESLMRKWGPGGRDHYMMAIVEPDK